MKVYFDGELAHDGYTSGTGWKDESDIAIPSGTQVIGIECKDNGGQYGILASTVTDSASTDGIFTNSQWKCATEDIAGWSAPGFKDKKDPNQDFKAASKHAGINGNKHPFQKQNLDKNIDSKAEWIWAADAGEDDTVFCKIRI